MNRDGARPGDEERTVVVSLSRARTQVSATSFWEEAPTTGIARSARPASPGDYVDRAVGGFRLVELLGSSAKSAAAGLRPADDLLLGGAGPPRARSRGRG
ncbi:MAG: hypothetical protein HY720_30435 [Planctomycetes bacterium]|nr:hypothetical protein [Planctomycetota bacterium]